MPCCSMLKKNITVKKLPLIRNPWMFGSARHGKNKSETFHDLDLFWFAFSDLTLDIQSYLLRFGVLGMFLGSIPSQQVFGCLGLHTFHSKPRDVIF